MKSPTKSELQSFSDRLKTGIKRLNKRVAELAEARADAEIFTATLGKLGMPSYKDDAAIQQVATTNLKLKSCQDVIAKLEEEISDLSNGEARLLIEDGARLACSALTPALDEFLANVTKILRPFYESEFRARNAAETSDAGGAAYGKVQQYGIMANFLDRQTITTERLKEAFKKIDAVVSEALKPTPNLQPFLSFDPIFEEEEAESPTASV